MESSHLWKAADEFISKGLFAGLLYEIFLDLQLGVLPLGADQAEFDIFVDCVVKEEWLLLDQTNLPPPPFEVNVSEGTAADRDQAIAPPQAL